MSSDEGQSRWEIPKPGVWPRTEPVPAESSDNMMEIILRATYYGSVICEQYFWLNLHKSVQHSAHAVVRTDTGPYGAQGGSSQHRHEGLDMIRNKAGDDISRFHARGTQSVGAFAYCLAQLCPRRRADIPVDLGGGDNGSRRLVHMRVRGKQQVLGKVQQCADEEIRAREDGRISGQGLLSASVESRAHI